MDYFNDNDLELIEELKFNSELLPSYDVMKNCLVWDDERPDGLTPDGYEKLCDLWIARSFIHRDIPFSTWELDPEYFEQVWKDAMNAEFKWPGFNRLKLTEKEKVIYLKGMKEQLSNEEL